MAEEGYVKFLVRLPAGLMAAVKAQATQNDRTVTGEIVHRLRLSLQGNDGRPSNPDASSAPHGARRSQRDTGGTQRR
jgi:hypothetical protein